MRGYDEWKTASPDDENPCCDCCGAFESRHSRAGWQPDECTGECGRRWRDPDYEYEARRDEPDEAQEWHDYDPDC